MTIGKHNLVVAIFVLALAAPGRKTAGQTSQPEVPEPPPQAPIASLTKDSTPQLLEPSLQPLLDFKDSDIKFRLQTFMNILRDRNHEGWVLAAYPDPNTSRPLMGAGFSLDVAATEHPQHDPFNSHFFVEPSSVQLWQAAGLDLEQLQSILNQFDRNLQAWGKKNYRKKIKAHTLSAALTEEEATRLLRISAIQAIQNAKAYCRDFDQLTAAQQMALSQLVFQMGVNLEEFVQFLSALNGDTSNQDVSQPVSSAETEAEHWQSVQRTLIDSQWARRYTNRAATVIAMFDSEYVRDPSGAERRVVAILRPPVKHHRKRLLAVSLRTKSGSKHSGKTPRKKVPGSRQKRKLT